MIDNEDRKPSPDNNIIKIHILTCAPKLEDSEIGVAKLIMEFRPV